MTKTKFYFCQSNDQFGFSCTLSHCEFVLPHCSVMCFSTLFVLFYFKLCVYVCPLVSLTPPLYLSLPSRSCHSDLSDGFCFVVCRCLSGEGGQGDAAGRGAEPQAEQPAAAGGVAEHSGPPHQSHRAAVQRQQALLASQLHAQIHKWAERCKSYNVLLHLFCLCIFAKANTHTHTYSLQSVFYHSLCPESWTCLWVREYANHHKRENWHFQHPMTFIDWPMCSS